MLSHHLYLSSLSSTAAPLCTYCCRYVKPTDDPKAEKFLDTHGDLFVAFTRSNWWFCAILWGEKFTTGIITSAVVGKSQTILNFVVFSVVSALFMVRVPVSGHNIRAHGQCRWQGWLDHTKSSRIPLPSDHMLWLLSTIPSRQMGTLLQIGCSRLSPCSSLCWVHAPASTHMILLQWPRPSTLSVLSSSPYAKSTT
jgi:hypothetical protein